MLHDLEGREGRLTAVGCAGFCAVFVRD
jgi:hypothetical protein